MKYIICSFLFLACQVVSAQDTLGSWSFGIAGGVDRCYRSLNVESDESAKSLWDSLESPVLRATAGVRISYYLRSSLQVVSGMYFTEKGYRIDTLEEAGLHQLAYRYRFLELPLGFIFSQKVNAKNDILFGSSFSARILLSDPVYYQKLGQTAEFEMVSTQENNRLNLNVSAMLGVRRHITNTATLDLFLSGNQSVTALADGVALRYLNSVGIHIVLARRF